MRHSTTDSNKSQRTVDARPLFSSAGEPNGGAVVAEPAGAFSNNRFESHHPINIILGATRGGTAPDDTKAVAKQKLKPAGAWHKTVLLWFMYLPLLIFLLLVVHDTVEDLLSPPGYGAFGWGGPEVDSSFTRFLTRLVLLWTGMVGTREILT
jgi:hypothetical protein